MKIFLDDMRSPLDCVKYMHTRIGKQNPIYLEGDWYIVRNYGQFVKAIKKFAREITHISFDHDLADEHYHESMDNKEAYAKHLETVKEKTGCDCAKFLVQHFTELNLPLPTVFIHSMNPVGCENIFHALKS